MCHYFHLYVDVVSIMANEDSDSNDLSFLYLTQNSRIYAFLAKRAGVTRDAIYNVFANKTLQGAYHFFAKYEECGMYLFDSVDLEEYNESELLGMIKWSL